MLVQGQMGELPLECFAENGADQIQIGTARELLPDKAQAGFQVQRLFGALD